MRLLNAVAFGLPWLLLLRQLWPEWDATVHYGYGKIVPLLVAGLTWYRWRDRPAARPPSGWACVLARVGIAVGLAVIACILPVREANPEWRLLSWAMACAVVGITWAGLYLAGGMGWMRHFAFPAAFILVAVPWPRPQETALVLDLMGRNMAAVAEILHWLGIEAVRRGNTILIAGQVLGMDEACSGIRSLQSTIMASLFFGEYYRLRLLPRAGLFVLGLGAALAGNLLRALALCLATDTGWGGGVHGLHDPAGYTVLAFAVGILWLAARLAAGRGDEAVAADASGGRAKPPLSALGAGAVVGWLVLAALGVEGWYRWKERAAVELPSWEIRVPEDWPGIEEVPISPAAQAMLRYDVGFSKRWTDTRGLDWQFFHMRWAPGSNSVAEVAGHDPRACLGGTGFALERTPGPYRLRVGEGEMVFRHYVFREGARPLQVFYCVMEDRMRPDDMARAWEDGRSYGARWRAVREGRRNLGQRMVEVVIWGLEDEARAREMLRDWLERVVEWEGGRGSDE